MANIDSVSLLKANPAENLSNLKSIDQAESHTDQSVASFPEELQAAKQNNKQDDADFERDRQESLEAQGNLQNLPTNPSIDSKQAAKIADKPKESEALAPAELKLSGPTLTQLGVAQSISAEGDLASQLAAPVPELAVQGIQPPVEGVNDGQVASIELLGEAIDPTVTAPTVAIAQAPGLSIPQNMITPLSSENTTPGLDSLAAVSVSTGAAANQVIDVNMTTEADLSALNSAPITVAQNDLEAVTNSALSLDPDVLVSSPVQADADLSIEYEFGALSTMAAASTDSEQNMQLAVDGNAKANVMASAANQSVQEDQVTQDIVSAKNVNMLAAEDLAATTANTTQAAQVAAGTAAVQDTQALLREAKASTNTNANTSAAVVAPTDVVSETLGADASETQDLANLTQSSSANSLRVTSRTNAAEEAGDAIQNLRIDNARVAGLNNEKSVAVDNLAMQDSTQPDNNMLTQTSSNNNANGLSDLNSRNMTSPFNQELRLAQSPQSLKLEPQQASLATGPLHVEVMRVLKEGGGRVIMEVTPPDQGAIQLDLRLDGNGKAYLIVEGASDSTKARLEQGGSQLKEQLAQMGLSLSMDMRDRSSQSDGIPFVLNNNFPNAGNGSGADMDAQLGDLMPLSRPGITPDGRVSIYA